jgi:hypothetical protein
MLLGWDAEATIDKANQWQSKRAATNAETHFLPSTNPRIYAPLPPSSTPCIQFYNRH